MKKKEFNSRFKAYMDEILSYIERDISHDAKSIVVTIDRQDEIYKLSNKVIDDGLPFVLAPPVYLHDPREHKEKPKSFQEVLDRINDIIV